MGYEVTFYYHEKIDDDYDKTTEKEFTKKLGKKEEEIDLEKLGRFILTHLARRDVWITKVKVYEYKKTEISFRETKGGIVLKNKKFLLDGNLDITYFEEEPAPQPVVPAQTQAIQAAPPQVVETPETPHFEMIYFPEDHPAYAVALSKLKLIRNKKYGIYGAKKLSDGLEQYKLKDETGEFVYVSELHFVPAQASLNYGEIVEDQVSAKSDDIELSYGETVNY